MPDRPLWTWDDRSNRYRETATGRFIGISQMYDMRSVYLEAQKTRTDEIARNYLENNISLTDYYDQNKAIIKESYTAMYELGVGGRNMMTQADWGRVGGILREQYRYYDNLVMQVKNGEISMAQASARMKMYINSAHEALWRAIGHSLGIQLPAYPGDGSTQCLVNCQCSWNIVPVGRGEYDCYWELGPAEHCDDCKIRAEQWNPFRWPEGRNNNG